MQYITGDIWDDGLTPPGSVTLLITAVRHKRHLGRRPDATWLRHTPYHCRTSQETFGTTARCHLAPTHSISLPYVTGDIWDDGLMPPGSVTLHINAIHHRRHLGRRPDATWLRHTPYHCSTSQETFGTTA